MSILDYADVVAVFRCLPGLQEALLHRYRSRVTLYCTALLRRRYSRAAEQPSFPLQCRHRGQPGPNTINIMDF